MHLSTHAGDCTARTSVHLCHTKQKRHIVLAVAAGHSHAMILALETKPHSLPSQMANRWQTISQAHTGLGECAHNTLVVAALYTACKCNSMRTSIACYIALKLC
jgi:pheromone shutdown protein TraB